MQDVLKAGAVALVVAAPANAQSGAEAYLDELIGLYEASGLTMEYAGPETDGDAVTIRDVKMTMDGAQGSGVMQMESITVRPTDEPGYDFEVVNAPDLTGSFSQVTDAGEVAASLTGKITGRALVGGPADARIMAPDYPQITITYSIDGNEAADMPPMDVTVDMSELGGTVVYDISAATQEYDMTTGAVTMTVAVDDPDQGKFDLNATYSDIAIVGSGPIVDASDGTAIFTSNTRTDLSMTAQSTTSSIKVEGPEAFELDASSGLAELTFNGGEGQLDYLVGADDVSFEVSGSAIPFPEVGADMARYEVRFAMPVVPTDSARTAAIRLNMDGVTISDALWGMFDPQAALPRDPATILIDLSGAARATTDLMAPDAAAAMAAGMPVEFDDVTINALTIRLAGAEITGSGSAEINNAGPFPMPVGGVDLRFEGINGLMDTLTSIGLLPAEQAMPAKMMLGMFAQPGDGPDVFTTRIEAGADGSITANGIPLQ